MKPETSEAETRAALLLSGPELEALRAQYKPIITRGDVIALGAAFGLTRSDMRKLLDGGDPVLRPAAAPFLSGARRYRRDLIIHTLNHATDE